MKRAVREGGWEEPKRVEVVQIHEPVYFHNSGELFGHALVDKIYNFEKEIRKYNEYDHKLDNSLIRSKSKMFEYALCNKFEYFVTLTLNKDLHNRYDLSNFKKKLGKFLDNYKQRNSCNIQYVLVPEFHKDGAVHMHGLIKGIPNKDLQQNEYGYLDWTPYSKRFGYFSCSPIRDYENCAKYVTKYITKELKSMPKGSQILLCSKGLKTAQILAKGYDIEYNLDNADFENAYVKIAWVTD